MTPEPEIHTATTTDKKIVVSVVCTAIEGGQLSRKRRFLAGSLPEGLEDGFAYFRDEYDYAKSFTSMSEYEAHAYFWRTGSVMSRYVVEWDTVQVEEISRTVVRETRTTLERVTL